MTDVINLKFSRAKLSHRIFYTSGTATITSDGVSFNIFSIPYLEYNGEYYIHGIVRDDHFAKIFCIEKYPLGIGSVWNISITLAGRKVMIYNKHNEGLILKD